MKQENPFYLPPEISFIKNEMPHGTSPTIFDINTWSLSFIFKALEDC